jgi:hypothetical protein
MMIGRIQIWLMSAKAARSGRRRSAAGHQRHSDDAIDGCVDQSRLRGSINGVDGHMGRCDDAIDGCVDRWLRGSMAAWIDGCVDESRLRGSMAAWMNHGCDLMMMRSMATWGDVMRWIYNERRCALNHDYAIYSIAS